MATPTLGDARPITTVDITTIPAARSLAELNELLLGPKPLREFSRHLQESGEIAAAKYLVDSTDRGYRYVWRRMAMLEKKFVKDVDPEQLKLAEQTSRVLHLWAGAFDAMTVQDKQQIGGWAHFVRLHLNLCGRQGIVIDPKAAELSLPHSVWVETQLRLSPLSEQPGVFSSARATTHERAVRKFELYQTLREEIRIMTENLDCVLPRQHHRK